MNLSPVPADQPGATCASCGAAVVSDQRYCLSCGQPVSPVRLAFLDVLGAEQARAAQPTQQWLAAETLAAVPAYAPAPAIGAGGWLRRNSPWLSLLSVLVLCLIAGLLLGHWASQGRSSTGPQVVKIEGLAAAPAAAAGPATTTASKASSSKPAEKEEPEESAEAAKETKQEKAPPPPPVKISKTKIQKLTQSSGRKHQEEINSLGAQPIETG
jgi:hypothetical protein